MIEVQLSSSQKKGLEILESSENIFLTGAAGSGKSFLLKQFLKNRDRKYYPVVASTGAAAILIGGRTFHSFFGLGILEGGVQATIERALRNKRLITRLKETREVIIDEVSMLSGKTLNTAEVIARKARGNSTPWGGLRIIAVGDFAQLPPVNPYGNQKEWAFLDEVWETSQFRPIVLSEVMRSSDFDFLEVLNSIRNGHVNQKVREFLTSRTIQSNMDSPSKEFQGTRLLARRDAVENYNLKKLDALEGKLQRFETEYKGKEPEIEKFKKNAPIPDVLCIKTDAVVMLRQNDPEGRWVNGSLGNIEKITEQTLTIRLLNGREIELGRADFTLLDADGEPVVTARNFPVSLAWAITIHKAQGTTLDRAVMDLRNLWEPGQAYVALSRVRNPDGVFLEGWGPASIKADPAVIEFHRNFQSGLLE